MQQSISPLTRLQATLLYVSVLLFVLIGCGWSFYWMRIHTHLPLWGKLLILTPANLFILSVVWFGWRSHAKNDTTPYRAFAIPFGIVALLIAIYVSNRTAKFGALVTLYGFSTVQTQHLHFISTEKAQPWVVSNGDHLKDVHYLWSIVSGDIFVIVFVGIYLPIYLLLLKRGADGTTRISFAIYRRKRHQ